MTMLDLVIYSWAFLPVAIFSTVCPPLLALLLLLPRWHSRRVQRRVIDAANQRLAARQRWLEDLASR